MSNSFSTITQITNESMRVAHASLKFLGTMDRQYDPSFAKTGAKIGSTLRVRKPDEFTVSTSSRVMDLQEQAEGYEELTLATQYHVDMYMTSDEMTMDLDKLSERKIKPAVKRLVSKVESVVLQGCTKGVYNCQGTAGTALANSGDLAAFVNARARINQGLAPMDDRYLQIDSVSMGAVVNGVKGLFAPQDKIGKAFNEGYYGRAIGTDWYENDHVYTHTVGSDVTGKLDATAAVTDGGSAMTLDSSGDTMSLLAGDVFTVAGVFACHPETKVAFPYLQQFTVVSGTTGILAVSPSTYFTGAKQNICTAASAAVTATTFNDAVVTPVGAINASYRQPLMYHKEAFAFVTADLPLFAGADKCARLTEDGLSLRVWQDGDIINDRMLLRIDMLFGYKVLRPAWACRLIGSASA
jgi:hypothetical protein